MKLLKSLKGYRPVTFVPGGILLAKGYALYVGDLECKCVKNVGAVPHSINVRFALFSRLLQRMLRLGIRTGCAMPNNLYLLAEKNRIWLLDLNTTSIQLDHILVSGARPLQISYIQGVRGFDDVACYGEYLHNKKKEPVNIWIRSNHNKWNIAYTFPKGKIEHIHAVVPDKKRGLVWILTGDFESSPGIWAAYNNFSSIVPVLVGRQEFRCCWLAFLDDRIIYATDTPLEPNSVRELVYSESHSDLKVPLNSARAEYLCEISGSSIYSCMIQDQLVFSTTVEPGLATGKLIYDLLECKPGPGIKKNSSDLVMGNLKTGFAVVGTWRKDRFPPRLCEYGSISFPSGDNPGRYLYAYFTGLREYDGCLNIFELTELR